LTGLKSNYAYESSDPVSLISAQNGVRRYISTSELQSPSQENTKMAEILGVIASGITLAGAAIAIADKVTNLIGQVVNASEELLSLHHDVTDTRLILWNIKENASQDQSLCHTLSLNDSTGTYGNPENIAKTEFLIRRIERVLSRLDLVLREVTKSKMSNQVTIHQISWMSNRVRIRSLRMELRDLKASLTVHLSVSTG
jgi:hypothetical protein